MSVPFAVLLSAGLAPLWIPVGVSGSRLHVFVDQRSVERHDGLVEAVVRIGSPTSITGKIVIVYQSEQFDCSGRRWRLTAYEGVDANGTVVSRKTRPATLPPLMPVQPNSIGYATLDTVCFIAKGLR
jgi:hypothetical protein